MRIKLIYLFLVLGLILIAINLSLSQTRADSFSVIINEIFPDPDGADGGKEWIELYNVSQSSIDLNNWKIKNTSAGGTVRNIVLPSVIIQPNNYLIVADSNSVVLSTNISSDTNIVYLTLGTVNLFNTNSKIDLYNSTGGLIESIDYANTIENKSWERKGPLCPEFIMNSNANSLALINLANNNLCWPDNNIISYPLTNNPTPETEVISYPALPVLSYPASSINLPNFDMLMITEVYASPNTGEKEWIELFNYSNADIDLSDYKLKDVNSSDEFDKFYSLTGTIFKQSYLALEPSVISLNNSGDRIGLFYKDILIDEVKYPTLAKSESYSRVYKDGAYTKDWFETFKVTKEKVNADNSLELVTIANLIPNYYNYQIKIQGCLTLVKSVMPDNYAYIQDSSASIKIRFVDDSDLNIGDCLEVKGKLIKTTKESYFYSESFSGIKLTGSNSAILLNKSSNYRDFEGKNVAFSNLKIKRRYSYSMLLENDLKMKYPEDFESEDYQSGDSIDIEGVIINLSGNYYIYPIKITKSGKQLNTLNEQSIDKNTNTPSVKGISIKDTQKFDSQSQVIYVGYIYFCIWLVANCIVFNKQIILLKNKLDIFIKEKVKYLNAERTSYFGKDVFHRDFPKEISKT